MGAGGMKLNRGEWAELYAKTTLTLSGWLSELDQNLDPVAGKSHKIVSVHPDPSKYEISLVTFDSTSEGSELERLNKKFFDEIREGDGPSFTSEAGVQIAEKLGIASFKSGSTKKADVGLKLKSQYFSEGEVLGFSVKSHISSPPTLLNASKLNTNFQFEIIGELIDWTSFNSKEKTLPRLLQEIIDAGGSFSFKRVRAGQLQSSMDIFSASFAQEVSRYLLFHYLGRGSNLLQILTSAATSKESNWLIGAQYRLGKFLEAIALGLTPTTLWNPDHAEWGGYIVVKKDGSVGGLRAFNSSALTNYLLSNTKFDTPSKKRHGYGFVYETDGRFYIDLAIQLRGTL